MHLESDNTETKKSIYNLYISELIDNCSNNRWNSVLKNSSFTHIQSLFFFFLHFGEEKKSRCRLRGLVRNCVYQRTFLGCGGFSVLQNSSNNVES